MNTFRGTERSRVGIFVSLPKAKYRLVVIHPHYIVIHNETRPSLWVRFWHWFLLGWYWEDIIKKGS